MLCIKEKFQVNDYAHAATRKLKYLKQKTEKFEHVFLALMIKQLHDDITDEKEDDESIDDDNAITFRFIFLFRSASIYLLPANDYKFDTERQVPDVVDIVMANLIAPEYKSLNLSVTALTQTRIMHSSGCLNPPPTVTLAIVTLKNLQIEYSYLSSKVQPMINTNQCKLDFLSLIVISLPCRRAFLT